MCVSAIFLPHLLKKWHQLITPAALLIAAAAAASSLPNTQGCLKARSGVVGFKAVTLKKAHFKEAQMGDQGGFISSSRCHSKLSLLFLSQRHARACVRARILPLLSFLERGQSDESKNAARLAKNVREKWAGRS